MVCTGMPQTLYLRWLATRHKEQEPRGHPKSLLLCQPNIIPSTLHSQQNPVVDSERRSENVSDLCRLPSVSDSKWDLKTNHLRPSSGSLPWPRNCFWEGYEEPLSRRWRIVNLLLVETSSLRDQHVRYSIRTTAVLVVFGLQSLLHIDNNYHNFI